MILDMNTKQFGIKLAGRIEKYQFQVGILEDGPHFKPVDGNPLQSGVLRTYAGTTVRKASREPQGTLSQVSHDFRTFLGINFLVAPFKKKDSEIIKFTEQFMKFIFQKDPNPNRLTNLLQAIVRNPILRGDYGSNSAATVQIKGFDKLGMDTGQLFKNIKAAVFKRGK